MEQEIWKDIEGFSGYQISNLGRVKSYHNNTTIIRKTNIVATYEHLMLNKNKKKYNFYIHRLVANAFIPNPENKPEVNHKNGIQYDNNVSNLEWVTKSENCKHAYSKSLKREKKSWSREEVKQLCKLAFKYHCDNPRTTSLPDKWIEENL